MEKIAIRLLTYLLTFEFFDKIARYISRRII